MMATRANVRKTLPGRLSAVVDLVPTEARAVADIGYDHGYALVLAAEKLPETRLCGVEKLPGAARRLYTAPLPTALFERLELFDGDGFEPIRDRDLDAAILAGMGEATVLSIAERHPALRQRVARLIVCTPQMPAVLRPGFARLGYGVEDERLAYDGRRFYEVVAFGRDSPPGTDPLELLFGPVLLRHPFAREYLAQRVEDWHRLLEHRGSQLTPLADWPAATPENAGEFQRIKVRALDEARRRVRQR